MKHDWYHEGSHVWTHPNHGVIKGRLRKDRSICWYFTPFDNDPVHGGKIGPFRHLSDAMRYAIWRCAVNDDTKWQYRSKTLYTHPVHGALELRDGLWSIFPHGRRKALNDVFTGLDAAKRRAKKFALKRGFPIKLLPVLLAIFTSSCAVMYSGVVVNTNPTSDGCRLIYDKLHRDKPVGCWCLQEYRVGDRALLTTLEVNDEMCFGTMTDRGDT